ncbi:MAG: presqualene diphosphate synthase HpnD [Deltaproteobacteria bacterium]|nr:presqualene diphosphate synthase HpnD [Deltaproteobacteria bacterium]
MKTQALGAAPLAPATDARAVVKSSKSNFVLSFLALPPEQREGISHFYALSRVVDDAVDEHGAEEAERLLNFWREEIAACYSGTPTHPVTRAMQDTIRRFEIPRRYLDLLVEGCEMDLRKKRYENFQELYEYCYRVAGVIGLVCMKIFGLGGKEAESSAVDLGLALQLTNILRDIKVDAGLGRLYVPQEEIRRFGLQEQDLLAGKMRPKLLPLLQFQAERAQGYFDRAFAAMKSQPHKPLIAAWIMGKTYRRILKKIRASGYDVFTRPIKLSKWQKSWIALRERFF